jgi:hypothetical protein
MLALGLAGCGGDKPLPEPLPEEQPLDPYRSQMADRINGVIYSELPADEMLAQLALLGVAPGKVFGEFKEESGIDDWFSGESDLLATRYTSLTCGLSPVVDGDGKITALYRSRKRIDGKLHEEMALTPDR